MGWFFIAVGMAAPVTIALFQLPSYGTAIVAGAAGLALYLLNIALIGLYIRHRASETLRDDTWESTAGRGIVPKWVSVIGLIGLGLIIGGVVVAVSIVLELL